VNSVPLEVPDLLRKYGLRPNKRLGQNFLLDETALQRVIDASGLTTQDDVLEIGPGLGSLTRLLAIHARAVVAVELDEGLLPPLQEVIDPYHNVTIHQGDILAYDPVQLMGSGGYLVIANIPYYITSAVIRHLLESKAPPQRLVLTVQREVAERICATPGDMSLLALSVQVYGAPRVMGRIPAGAFYPVPQVDSAIVRVDLFQEPVLDPAVRSTFFRLAKAGFSQKRKKLRNALAGGMHWSPDQASTVLQSAGIDPQRRAETLSLEEWLSLTDRVQHLA
jgi:16S rRNA (adenine1518-N6/adenine1519-N6)-dimethyltransferase